MQRLDLDFCRDGTSSPWVGRLLLAAAVAFSADVAWSYKQGRDSVQSLESRIAALPRPSAPAPQPTADDIAAARETVERLAMPWDGLFAALESAASEDVALLGIEPDTKAGTVLISGDSKDYLAALTYVLNLGRSGALTDVQLVRHEAKPKDPHGAVSFAVSAAWIRRR